MRKKIKYYYEIDIVAVSVFLSFVLNSIIYKYDSTCISINVMAIMLS